jgi:uncharacterized protein YraI
VAALLLGLLVVAPSGLAHAPALATTLSDLAVRATPSGDAAVVVELPAGTTVELTGSAAGDFLEIVVDGAQGWVGVEQVDAGGLDTAAVITDAVLRAEPSTGGAILRDVPAGGTVLLTGAAVDGYLAAAFEGTGGWLAANALA